MLYFVHVGGGEAQLFYPRSDVAGHIESECDA